MTCAQAVPAARGKPLTDSHCRRKDLGRAESLASRNTHTVYVPFSKDLARARLSQTTMTIIVSENVLHSESSHTSFGSASPNKKHVEEPLNRLS